MRFRKLLSEEESGQQNWILSEAEEGAFVEDHPVARSEAFYVLEGEIDVFGPGWRELVRKGDFIYFAAGASHGMRVIRGPARYLVVFA